MRAAPYDGRALGSATAALRTESPLGPGYEVVLRFETLLAVAPAPDPLSLRLGADGLRALDELARRRGISRAEAARRTITETAARARRRAGLAAEARRLMEDRTYVNEAREVAALMEELRGPR